MDATIGKYKALPFGMETTLGELDSVNKTVSLMEQLVDEADKETIKEMVIKIGEITHSLSESFFSIDFSFILAALATAHALK